MTRGRRPVYSFTKGLLFNAISSDVLHSSSGWSRGSNAAGIERLTLTFASSPVEGEGEVREASSRERVGAGRRP